MMTSKLAELQVRWSALNDLATRVSGDDRRLSTPLAANDVLARSAWRMGIPMIRPLTVGTLLAAVLAEIDNVEMAMETVRRHEHPGEDLPDTLAPWQRSAPAPATSPHSDPPGASTSPWRS